MLDGVKTIEVGPIGWVEKRPNDKSGLQGLKDGYTLTSTTDGSLQLRLHWREPSGQYLEGFWWRGPAEPAGLQKRHALQGPIDDAFMNSFLFAKPTGKPLNEAVGKWADSELNHAVTGHVRDHGAAPREAVEPLVLMLAPLAPHLAAELWERLGHHDPLDDLACPVPDPEALVAEAVVLPVTVDGRRRGEITVAGDAGEDEVRRAALALAPVARLAAEDRVARVVHVPGRIVNVVTRA
jgi:hypothetical protein